MPESPTFSELLHQRLRSAPESRRISFVRDGEPDHELTLGQLDRTARGVAVRIAELVPPRTPVLLLYPEGVDFAAAFLGCLHSGTTAVPAPLPDRNPRSLDRLNGILADCPDITLVLTTSTYEPVLAEWLSATGHSDRVRLLSTDHQDDPSWTDPEAWRQTDVTPDDLALLQYTSGSTSRPRGVMVSHGNLVSNTGEIAGGLQLGPECLVAGWLPHYHDMGLIGQLLAPLSQGASVATMAPVTFLKRPRRWLEAVTRFRATHSAAPDFAYALCVRTIGAHQLDGLDLSSWKVSLNGAEPIRADVVEAFAGRFSAAGLNPGVLNPSYGMAEATLLVTRTPVGRNPLVRAVDAESLERGEAVRSRLGAPVKRLVGCGFPVEQELRIVDPETLEVRPDRTVGEIWSRGASVAQGYRGHEELSRRTFRAVTADGQGPFLRTGDLGFLDDGELFITGRAKDLIIVNGRNIYPQDIEQAVRDLSPALESGIGAVFATGPDKDRIVVIQETRTTALQGEHVAELAVRLRRAVSREFELRVEGIALVARGAIPRTTSGKVQRALTARLWDTGGLKELYRWSVETRPVGGFDPEAEQEQVVVLSVN